MELQNINMEPGDTVALDQTDDLSLVELLIFLVERKKLIVFITLAAALLGMVGSVLLPNRYTATAKILPPQQNQSSVASLMGQLGALGPMAAMAQNSLGIKNPNDIYVGMLKSRTMEDALIRRFDLLKVYHLKKMSDARKELEDNCNIELGKEGFISISVEDKSSVRSAEMANAYVDELRALTQNFAVTEAGQRRLFFEQQLEQAKNNLANAEQALKKTQEKTGIIQLDGQAKAIIESVVKLRAQIAAKDVELQGMRSFATERNPDVILQQHQLVGMREQLKLLEKQSGGDGDIQVATGKVPGAGLEYVRKLRDVKYFETIFELLARQYEAARLDEAKSAAVIQVLDPAVEPDRRSSPKRILIVIAAAVVGFFGALIYTMIAEAVRRMRMEPQKRISLDELRAAVHSW